MSLSFLRKIRSYSAIWTGFRKLESYVLSSGQLWRADRDHFGLYFRKWNLRTYKNGILESYTNDKLNIHIWCAEIYTGEVFSRKSIIKFILNYEKIIAVLLILFVSDVFAQKENQFIFLIDNSGSMSPYYRTVSKLFLGILQSAHEELVKKDDNADVMLFTKTDPKRGISSPKVLFSGKADALIPDEVMSKFNLTTGKDNNMTGTTDLIEALDKGIAAVKGNTGIIYG